LDRAGYFDRCWSGAGQGQQFDLVRVVESGGEVIVTYEMTKVDGCRGRNTEIFTFSGDKIARRSVLRLKRQLIHLGPARRNLFAASTSMAPDFLEAC
jgi:hypothetical protein